MEEQQTCETCKHFVPHYYKFGKGYRPTVFGHCTEPRCRCKGVDNPACHRYAPKR